MFKLDFFNAMPSIAIDHCTTLSFLIPFQFVLISCLFACWPSSMHIMANYKDSINKSHYKVITQQSQDLSLV